MNTEGLWRAKANGQVPALKISFTQPWWGHLSGWCWSFICHWVQTSLKIRSNVKLFLYAVDWNSLQSLDLKLFFVPQKSDPPLCLKIKGRSFWSHKHQFGCSKAWDVLPKIAKQKVVTLGDPGCGHPAKYKNKDCQRKEVRFLVIVLTHLDRHNSWVDK